MSPDRHRYIMDTLVLAIRDPKFRVCFPTIRSNRSEIWERVLSPFDGVREGLRIRGRGSWIHGFLMAYLAVTGGDRDDYKSVPGLFAALEACFHSEEFLAEVARKYRHPRVQSIVKQGVGVKGPLDVYFGGVCLETGNDDKVVAWFITQFSAPILVAIDAYRNFEAKPFKKARTSGAPPAIPVARTSELDVLERIRAVSDANLEHATRARNRQLAIVDLSGPPLLSSHVSPSPVPLSDVEGPEQETPTHRGPPHARPSSDAGKYVVRGAGSSSSGNVGTLLPAFSLKRKSLYGSPSVDQFDYQPFGDPLHLSSPNMDTASSASLADTEDGEQDTPPYQRAPHARPRLGGAKVGVPGGVWSLSESSGALLPLQGHHSPPVDDHLLPDLALVAFSRSPLTPKNMVGASSTPLSSRTSLFSADSPCGWRPSNFSYAHPTHPRQAPTSPQTSLASSLNQNLHFC
ncbi:hypothetical protein C8R43DRAFT_1053675 [Mycena crocata]|nr:hypothetical protein C8R43DRAFT_1053675 [Mycena crocata]